MNRKEVALAITNLETRVAKTENGFVTQDSAREMVRAITSIRDRVKAELDKLDARLKVVEATVDRKSVV